MRRFSKKLIIFLSILFISLNIIIAVVELNNDFIGGIKLKHKLLDSTEGRRIILIGGSGVGRSINSSKVVQKTKTQVINMGLFSHFGLRYMLSEVVDSINMGDIIIVIPEYAHFCYFFDGWLGLNQLVMVYPKFFKYINSKEQWWNLIKNFPEYYWGKIRNIPHQMPLSMKELTENPLYNRYGDYIYDYDSETQHLFRVDTMKLFNRYSTMHDFEINENVINELNNFAKICNDKGGQVYFLYPTIPINQYFDKLTYINRIEQKINEDGLFVVLGSPKNELQPNEDFYDTIYHLNERGKSIRTDRLINYLQDIL